jgi:hypothetical protein
MGPTPCLWKGQMRGATQTDPGHTYRIPKDRGEIRQCWYEKIAALPSFLKHIGLHPLQLVRGE